MNEGKQFSEYISGLRNKNNVSLQSLCEGLCTFQELSYLENGTRRLDRLLEDMLLERLGIGAEDDELYLGCVEYQRWLHRLHILHSIAYEQFGKAEALLEAYRAAYCGGTEGRTADCLNTPAADRLERQFYLGMLAQIRRCAGASGQRLHALFHEALTLTMPYSVFLNEGQKYLTISEQSCIQNLMLAMDEESPEFMTCLRHLEEIYQPYEEAEILDAVSGRYEYIIGYARSTWGNLGQYDKSDE